MVLPSLEPPAHTLRALEICWHAGEGLPHCPVTSRGSSGAANDRAGEEYQIRAPYQIRANALLGTLPQLYPSLESILFSVNVPSARRAQPSPLLHWPLHDIAITNIVCCMAKEGEAGGNRILNGGGSQYTRC